MVRVTWAISTLPEMSGNEMIWVRDKSGLGGSCSAGCRSPLCRRKLEGFGGVHCAGHQMWEPERVLHKKGMAATVDGKNRTALFT